MLGTRRRQEHLERIIEWRTGSKDDSAICNYMARHQSHGSAKHLWEYFKNIAEWIESIFWAEYDDFRLLNADTTPKSSVVSEKDFKKSLKGRDWGRLYKEYHGTEQTRSYTKKRQIELLADEEVTNKGGIYEYILSGEVEGMKKLLSLRAFPVEMKREKWRDQKKTCALCPEILKFEDAEADHIDPWSEGGKTERKNLQVLCARCHGKKTARQLRSAKRG